MVLADSLIIWLHLTCASIWVGGSIFVGIVLSPLIKVILVIATLSTYAIHVRILNTETERKLTVGNAGNIYVQSIRSKIISLGRITVILSVLILLFASLLHSGG